MPAHTPHINFYPLGEQALTLSFGNTLDVAVNRLVLRWQEELLRHPFDGFIEAIPAYCTLTVCYDAVVVKKQTLPGKTVAAQVEEWLRAMVIAPVAEDTVEQILHRIPVCYAPDFAPDLPVIAAQKAMSVTEVIERHCAVTYRVFMMGFLPGFPYLGIVDPAIAMPRLASPRPLVAAGSVGIAGQQTGIYPLASPGGWQLVGRTPLSLFTAGAANPFLCKTGDLVEFYPIDSEAFYHYPKPAADESAYC